MTRRLDEDEVWDDIPKEDDSEVEQIVPVGDPQLPDLPGVIGGHTRFLPGEKWTPARRRPVERILTTGHSGKRLL